MGKDVHCMFYFLVALSFHSLVLVPIMLHWKYNFGRHIGEEGCHINGFLQIHHRHMARYSSTSHPKLPIPHRLYKNRFAYDTFLCRVCHTRCHKRGHLFKMTAYWYLLGQLCSLQACSSNCSCKPLLSGRSVNSTLVGQSSAVPMLSWGSGLLHNRVRFSIPPPQGSLQAPHVPQSPQAPLTVIKIQCFIYSCVLQLY